MSSEQLRFDELTAYIVVATIMMDHKEFGQYMKLLIESCPTLQTGHAFWLSVIDLIKTTGRCLHCYKHVEQYGNSLCKECIDKV